MFSRRAILTQLSVLAGLVTAAGFFRFFRKGSPPLKKFALDTYWPTQEPFLFAVHHLDKFPEGTNTFGPPEAAHEGRKMGEDFQVRDGYRMYHGMKVPGFPVHPHRGFETITIVRQGIVDHSDSIGAAGRYGAGDVQWMTAGSGVQHSEMFPMLNQDRANTLELFQIWLNLPKASKRVEPHFKMYWDESVPVFAADKAKVRILAGEFRGLRASAPPPHSWAADPANGVSLLLITLEEGGQIEIPQSDAAFNRSFYFFAGNQIRVNGEDLSSGFGFEMPGDRTVKIENAKGPAEILLLQARPIGEPIVQHGPFVMNTRDDIRQTIEEYQRTHFGGWPWKEAEMVHGGLENGRFAKYPDGRIEKPKQS